MNKVLNKIGQNLIIGFDGTTPSEEFLKFLKENDIGGVIFFKKNYSDLETLINSINMLQKNSNHNLFISIDHEGGRVQRLTSPFTTLPSFRKQTKEKSQTQIFNNTRFIAKELKACGFNLNFAPVCDMIEDETGAIGDRSIGTDLEKVNQIITSTIRGYVKENIISSAKHFPGHGVIKDDTHIDMFESEKTLNELENFEITPFRKAIKSGVTSIMMSHIVFKNIENTPASFSKKLINFIRHDLRFNRLIISDDISMGAISKHYSLKESLEKAIFAGCDIIINSKSSIENISEAINTIKKEKETDTSFINKLKETHTRISLIKETFINKEEINYSNAKEALENSPLKTIF